MTVHIENKIGDLRGGGGDPYFFLMLVAVRAFTSCRLYVLSHADFKTSASFMLCCYVPNHICY